MAYVSAQFKSKESWQNDNMYFKRSLWTMLVCSSNLISSICKELNQWSWTASQWFGCGGEYMRWSRGLSIRIARRTKARWVLFLTTNGVRNHVSFSSIFCVTVFWESLHLVSLSLYILEILIIRLGFFTHNTPLYV